MSTAFVGHRKPAAGPIPGSIQTPTGTIVAGTAADAPGVAIVPGNTGAARDPQTKGRGKAMAAMGFSGAVDNSEGGLINTFFPLIAVAFGIGEGMLGVMSSISKFARMLFGPFWAMMADRFGRKRILVLVTGVWGLWTVAAGFAPNLTRQLIR
jgi:hypothetical protein